ncbi:hypothetical protein EX30DRAFT_200497 [Ascodesmis nigricans]|uniref:Uncharacterized protein n=1 Tax=Ascodesmis nigricans TaxID=341454 RepID=A0A4S2MKH3_9PEZI|nr:hypothetical protein EX30DRAFT_200497 [Ascodesmis nigricans]
MKYPLPLINHQIRSSPTHHSPVPSIHSTHSTHKSGATILSYTQRDMSGKKNPRNRVSDGRFPVGWCQWFLQCGSLGTAIHPASIQANGIREEHHTTDSFGSCSHTPTPATTPAKPLAPSSNVDMALATQPSQPAIYVIRRMPCQCHVKNVPSFLPCILLKS